VARKRFKTGLSCGFAIISAIVAQLFRVAQIHNS